MTKKFDEYLAIMESRDILEKYKRGEIDTTECLKQIAKQMDVLK